MKIKDLLSDESKWTQGALDINDKPITGSSSQASCWCLLEAANRCYQDAWEKFYVLQEIYKELRNIKTQTSIAEWNDAPERTFGEVKELVEKLGI